MDYLGNCALVEIKQGSFRFINLIDNNSNDLLKHEPNSLFDNSLKFESSTVSLGQSFNYKQSSIDSRSDSSIRKFSKQFEIKRFKNPTELSKFGRNFSPNFAIVCVKKGFFLTNPNEGVLFYQQSNNDPYSFNLLHNLRIKPILKQVYKSFKVFIIDLKVNQQFTLLTAVSNH